MQLHRVEPHLHAMRLRMLRNRAIGWKQENGGAIQEQQGIAVAGCSVRGIEAVDGVGTCGVRGGGEWPFTFAMTTCGSLLSGFWSREPGAGSGEHGVRKLGEDKG